MDEEFPTDKAPPGIGEVSVSHDMVSSSRTLKQYEATISGRYDVAKGADPRLALLYFLRTARSRINTVLRNKAIFAPPLPISFAVQWLYRREKRLYGGATSSASSTPAGMLPPRPGG